MGDISKVRAYFQREYRDTSGSWHQEPKKELAQFVPYDNTNHYYDYYKLPSTAIISNFCDNAYIDGKYYPAAVQYSPSGCYFPESFYSSNIFVDDNDIDYIRDFISAGFNLYPEYSYSTKTVFRSKRIAFKTNKDWYIFPFFSISFGKMSITSKRDCSVSLGCMCCKYLPEDVQYNDETKKWTHKTSDGIYAEMVYGTSYDSTRAEYFYPFFENLSIFAVSSSSLQEIFNAFNTGITKFKKLRFYPIISDNANPFIFERSVAQFKSNFTSKNYQVDVTNSKDSFIFHLCWDLTKLEGVTTKCFYSSGSNGFDLITEYLYNPSEKAPDNKPPGNEDDPNDDDPGFQPPDPDPDDDDDRGGDGDHDDSSDPIPVPPKPSIDASGVGLVTIWNPTSSQLASLGTKLWQPSVWEAIKQYFTNPLEAILGLAIIPVAPAFSSVSTIHLGGYDTEISSNMVSSDYVTVDLGSIPINRYYGSYLDYDGFTKISCYLPYIGEVDINPDQVMTKTLGLIYRVNVITGDCVAMLTIDGSVFASYSGNCARQIPICQSDFASIIQSSVSMISTIASAVATGGVSSAVAAGAKTEAAKDIANARAVANNTNTATSLVSDVLGMKLSYKHASQLGLGAAQLAPQLPFLTITRPNLDLPNSYKSFVGYPSNMNMHLGKCTGFTQVEATNLSVPSATQEELTEIIALLLSGVIF